MPHLIITVAFSMVNQSTKVGELVFKVEAQDVDSSQDHFDSVFYRIEGGNTVSWKKLLSK